ncbi:hypothetical protein [Pseudoduganella sp. RAF53_2]|uniref:hypothetical protein n=1 Tax=unclassified Pseudoduganella TaxID=2637179 RepID=UPI003F973D7B
MRNRQWKSMRPASVGEAMELCIEFAAEKKRRPVKVLADLMGVEVKTLYRWLAETSMPLNRVRQFEDFCGVSYVSEYLCLAQGDKVVVAIPSGKKADVTDLAEIQASFADAVGLLARFYKTGAALDETVAALTSTLTHLAYQRTNVLKNQSPEFDFGAAE